MENMVVHVIGAGYGECIIIEFPDRSVGIIDPYSGTGRGVDNNERPEFHPIIRLLENAIKPTAIRFVAITHPHADHCMGAACLLRHFEDAIQKFWIWPGFPFDGTMKYLLWLKSQNRQEDTEVELKLPPGTILKELHEIKEWFENHKDKVVYFAPGKNVEIPMNSSKESVHFCFLAPTDRFLTDLFDWLGPWSRIRFSGNKFIIPCDQLPSEPNLNHLSAVMILSWEKAKLLFCGDAETKTWEQILGAGTENDHRKNLEAGWVKISHHGSDSGYNKQFLSLIKISNPVGVLTPFYRGRKDKRLPTVKGLSDMYPCFRVICSTCLDKCKHIEGWERFKITGSTEMENLPASWMAQITQQPELLKAFATFPEKDLDGWDSDDFELPTKWYCDILKNPKLIELFRPHVREKVESAVDVLLRGPEHKFRVSYSFDDNGQPVPIKHRNGAGVYAPAS